MTLRRFGISACPANPEGRPPSLAQHGSCWRPTPSPSLSFQDTRGGFALFWEAAALTSDDPGFFALWGIPFAGFGLYFVFGRFLFKRRKKLRTAYGITPERVMVAVGTSALSDMPVRDVPMSMRRSRDGRHVTVTFGTRGGWHRGGMYANTGMDFWNLDDDAVAFFDVSQPEALLAAIERARRT